MRKVSASVFAGSALTTTLLLSAVTGLLVQQAGGGPACYCLPGMCAVVSTTFLSVTSVIIVLLAGRLLRVMLALLREEQQTDMGLDGPQRDSQKAIAKVCAAHRQLRSRIRKTGRRPSSGRGGER